MADSPTGQWEAQLAQLAQLSDEEITALEAELVSAFDAADQAGDTASLEALADAVDQVRAEQSKRGGGAPAEAPPVPVAADGAPTEGTEAPVDNPTVPTETETEAPEAQEQEQEDTDVSADKTTSTNEPAEEVQPDAAEAEPANTEGAPEGEAAEATEEEKGSTVATSSTVTVPRGHEPVQAAPGAPTVVTAGADIQGIAAGGVFEDAHQFGDAFAKRIHALRNLSGGDGEQVLIASIKSEAPADRVLKFNDPEGNKEKIEALTHLDSITAAGGFCAPLVTKYTLFDCGGNASRPVRDALAGFQADRGGLRFYPGPALADLNAAVGFWTGQDDEDALDVDGPTKACARINCPPEQTAEIQAVTLCLTFGVMQSRVFPELVVANNKLAMVAHARIAESALLAQIKAGSKAITDAGTPLSAVRDLMDTIGRAAIYFRDRYRLEKEMPLRVIFPQWVLDLLRGDIAWGEPVGTLRNTLSVSDSELEGFFRDRNLNVTWSLDSSAPGTLGGGFFANATTALPAWPTSVQWAMYPEGSWLYLDGGSLDLGIVRDSSLIRTNDYQQFSEVFEAAANIGCESLWITSAVNVSGRYNGPITPTS